MSAQPSYRVPSARDLVPLHQRIAQLDPSGPPRVELVCGPDPRQARRLVVLSGSFNPPHEAHIALLECAMHEEGAASGLFLLSTRTVDKEQVSGMLLEDRTWLLCALLEGLPGVSVALSNRGLYVDQAMALRGLYPALHELTFITGYDKIVQIFDPRYYEDRDAALEQLFTHAHLLVAPREQYGHADLERLLTQPENSRFAANVQPLSVPSDLAYISSTAVRQTASRHPDPPMESLVPPVVRLLIEQTGCYAQDSRYSERAAALRRAAEGLR